MLYKMKISVNYWKLVQIDNGLFNLCEPGAM